MNNLKQKNVIYGRDGKDILPHNFDGSVILGQNSNITDARINNMMQQLVNNDLYLENRMTLGLNYQAGPRGFSDEKSISAAPDGSKRWVVSDNYENPLRVFRKIDVPLSSSISPVRSGNVNFIAPIGDTVFISFSDGLMYETGSDFQECLDENGDKITATGYCDTASGTFFVSDTALYRLVQTVYNGYKTAYALQRIDIGNVSGLRCVSYDASNGMIYVGGENGVMGRGYYSEQNQQARMQYDIQFCADDVYGGTASTNVYTNDITVNDIKILDAKDESVNDGSRRNNIIAGTDKGAFRCSVNDVLNVKQASVFAGKRCVDVAVMNDVLYVLADDGYVYRQTNSADMTFEKYPSNRSFNSPTALFAHQSGLYVACGQGVFRYTETGNTPAIEKEYPLQGDAAVNDVYVMSLFGEKHVFAASGNKVYYYLDPEKDREVLALAGNWTIRDLVVQQRSSQYGAMDIYVIADLKNGGGSVIQTSLYAAYLQLGSQKETDYSVIKGLKLIAPSCDGAVTFDQTGCYYFKDGMIYNMSTGHSNRLGIVNVHEMEYLSSDNSIAIAAQYGSYLVDASTLDIIGKSTSTNAKNTYHTTQSDNIVYFSQWENIYAASRDSGANLILNEIPKGILHNNAIAGIAADDHTIYVLSEQQSLVSAQPYYVRPEYSTEDSDPVDAGQVAGSALPLDFPVMSSMTEVNISTAIGLSDGIAYALTFDGASKGYEPIDTTSFDGIGSSEHIKAFCSVASRAFVATDAGKVYQYECDSDGLDTDEIEDLNLICSSNVDADSLVYSGTDVTFDMRIYAQSGSSVKMYRPSTRAEAKAEYNKIFDDFIMYIDEVEVQGHDPEYYVVIAGISDSQLQVASNHVDDLDDSWGAVPVSYRLLDYGMDATLQTERTPYAIFYLGNSRVYVAYTAKIQDGRYFDYIAALKVDDLLSGSIGNVTDFYRICPVSAPDDGNIRFTGFSLPSTAHVGDDEDMDILAMYYKSGQEHVLLTFKADYNLSATTLSGSRQITKGFQDDPGYQYFQPDCAAIGTESSKKYYIALPAIMPGGQSLDIALFEYDKTKTKPCKYLGDKTYVIDGIPSNIKDVFFSGSPSINTGILEFIILLDDGKAYNMKVVDGIVSHWGGTPIQDGSQFAKISRFGINQLAGYTRDGNFFYDFQTKRKFIYSDIAGIYMTDSGDSRDFILAQTTDKKLYNIVLSQNMTFNDAAAGLGSNLKKLQKENGELFLFDLNWTGQFKIYRENQGGGFSSGDLFASGSLQYNAGVQYIDACLCYGVINEYSFEYAYYLFLLRSNGNIDVYAIGSNKNLEKICEFSSDGVNGDYFSSIAYGSTGGFKGYVQSSRFGNRYFYNWPIAAKSGNAGHFIYIDFDAPSELRFTEFSGLAGSYIGIGKKNGVVYGVIQDGSYTVIKSLADGTELDRCEINSRTTLDYRQSPTPAWGFGNRYFYVTRDNILYYHYGAEKHEIGNGEYIAAAGGDDGPCYFVEAKTVSGVKKYFLHESVSIPDYPTMQSSSATEVQRIGAAATCSPIRLSSGKTYAGLVCANSQNRHALCIIWPAGQRIEQQAGPGSGTVVQDYNVYACPATITGFPDSRENMLEIVPLGDYLDEIVIYEGGYLHIANVQDRKLIVDDAGTSNIDISQTMPWTPLGDCFASGIFASAKYGSMRYVAASTGLSAFGNMSSGLAMKILSPAMKAENIDVRSFYEIGQNVFLAATSKGVYRYQHFNGIPTIGRISPAQGYDVQEIVQYNFTGLADTYLMANGFDSHIYESENGRVWWKQYRPVPNGSVLNSVYPKNAKEWYFGASTGLYKSSYRYSEVDDIQKFTENDLYLLYAEMLSSDISDACEEVIRNHELSRLYELGHVSSLIYDIDTNLLGVDFDGLQSSGWQCHSGQYDSSVYTVSNDIVFEQYWGDNTDQNIALSVENMFVSTPNAKFTYLVRRWMSGTTEVYVHVPTTNTYYINHLSSTPNYAINEDTQELTAANMSQFGKSKQVFRHDPNQPGVYTKMKLSLSKNVFSVNSLMNVQACGNSLPLKIYKETIKENGGSGDYEAAQYFNSYAAPTVMLSMSADTDNTLFEFACFGSDEQVIRLEFIDAINKFDQQYCRIIFDSSGATDSSQFVKQRIRMDDGKYPLRRNQYAWPQDQKVFAGWTFTPNAGDNPDTSRLLGFYGDGYEMTAAEIQSKLGVIQQGQDIKLYAVWMTYQFGGTDTMLTLNPSPGKTTFKIGSVGVVAGAQPSNKVILKFEEVD